MTYTARQHIAHTDARPISDCAHCQRRVAVLAQARALRAIAQRNGR